MKRSIQLINKPNKPNKRIKLDDNNYIDSSSFINYMLDIPIFDYLTMYNYEKDTDKFNENIKVQSKLHLNYRIVELKMKCTEMNYEFDDLTNYKNHESADLTKEMMNDKISVIFNGYLRCDKMKIFSHYDVLIHSSVISEFLDVVIPSQLFEGYYQLLIIYNNNRDTKKNNVILYGKQKVLDSYFSSNCNFDSIFIQPFAFILSSTNTIYKVDLNQSSLFCKMNDAYKWIWELRENGHSWDIYNPTRYELLPNMKHSSTYGYKKIIQSIIHKNDELTSYNDITLEKRNECFQKNMTVDDALRDSGKPFLKSVAELRGTTKIMCDLSKLVVPKKRIFYVDFEYINSFHFKRDFSIADTNHLYLIGVIYEKNGEWLYKSFIPKAIDYMSSGSGSGSYYEVENIRDWIDFMASFGDPYCVMNWSTAEQSMLNSLSKQYHFELPAKIEWINLLKLFKTTINFVCDGMKSYSLKDVAKSMYKLGFIKTSWNDNVMNGLEANILLIPNFIKEEYILELNQSLSDIIKYNEIDCRVMLELFNFVVSIKHNKNNHILLYE